MHFKLDFPLHNIYLITLVDCQTFPAFALSYVVVMPKKRQALVEYEDMNGSSTAVTYAADNQVYIAGHPAFINYSTSQKISRPGDSDDSRSVNNVLLLTIMNPIYPITTVNSRCIITLCWNRTKTFGNEKLLYEALWREKKKGIKMMHVDAFIVQ